MNGVGFSFALQWLQLKGSVGKQKHVDAETGNVSKICHRSRKGSGKFIGRGRERGETGVP